MKAIQEISGQFVDLFERRIYPATVRIANGKIASVTQEEHAPEQFIMPGFVDAHIHIESSMLTPYEFARIALLHGTVATISDPHEIANVLGVSGVHYMLDNARDAKLKFHFGAPSCVPATGFESAGAVLDAEAVKDLLQHHEIYYLSEMMNYPGVLFQDEEVMKKIRYAKEIGKPIDGHAPGLRGKDAATYIASGISTDHECFTLDEALDKIGYGMKILIREGSAARNFEALHPLLKTHPEVCMFCCDDKHPDQLLVEHINAHVRKAIALGYDLFDVLRAASVNPVEHYRMRNGLLRVGDAADFIVVTDLKSFHSTMTVVDGEIVAENGHCFLPAKSHGTPNHFSCNEKQATDFRLPVGGKQIRIIEALDGQLITRELHENVHEVDGSASADASRDLLKMVVVNRYRNTEPAIAFVRNFGLKSGAIASSVAHDSHNIIAVGCDDESIARAVNLVIRETGGLSLVNGSEEQIIGLPIAGLMSDQDCMSIGQSYSTIDESAKKLGSKLGAPYMTLSFMALLVIPQLKLSDKGLFDGSTFCFSHVFLT